MRFVIPTLGRVDNQLTYNNLPDKYKEKVTFVVQPHEHELMQEKYPNNKVVCLPKEVNNIALTRQFIFNLFRGERYWVWDDDLSFVIKDWVDDGKRKWDSYSMEEKHFDEFVDHANEYMDNGYVHGGLACAWILPIYGPDVYPFRDNFRQVTNMFFDGAKMPDIDFCRADTVEDMDVTLQMISQGYKNVIFMRHRVGCADTNADGGCSTYRTVEYHNERMRDFQALWPDYIKLSEKEVTSGSWKGSKKLAANVQWKKAYADGVKKREQVTLF